MNKLWIKIAAFIFIIAFVVVFNYGGCGGSVGSGGGSNSGSSSLGPISISTNPATNITQASAILNGTVNPNGANTNVYFEYGPTFSYGISTGYQFIGSGTTPINVSVNLTGLSPNTAYNFRIKATRDGITYTGANETFITAGTLPTCVTNPATNITYNSARLNGSVTPNGIATSAYFQYGLTTSYTVTTILLAVGSGINIVLINTDIGGLSENTLYNFRIVGTSFAGITYGINRTFTTTAPPVPTCITKPATNITTNSATLNGTVNPNGIATSAYFNYGTTSYTITTTSQTLGSGTISLVVSATAGSLTPNTLHNFRVGGTNSYGTTYGYNLTFITGNTSGSAPTCITDPADNISYNSARLNGTVIPNGVNTYVYFEYGLNPSYSVTTNSQPIGNGTTSVAVSYTATGLSTNTLYNFRVAATSTAGATPGDNRTFTTTPAPPTCVINAADNITYNSARLNGTVNPNGLATTAYFEWGLSTSYGNNTDLLLLGSGTSDVIIYANITGFSANRIYYFRLRATNSTGGTISKYQTFGNWLETTFTTGAFYNTVSTTGAADITLSRINYGNGADGAVITTTSFNINTGTTGGRTVADGWNSRISTTLTANTATLVTTPPANTFATGDEVILINMKGISTAYPNVGNYEFLRVQSVSTNVVTFTTNKVNWYGDGANDTNIGNTTSNQRVMLQRVPNYTNVTINSGGSIICNAWNDSTGGVIAFRASGTVQVAGNGINATGLGFSGGTGVNYTVNAGGGESYNGTGGSGGINTAVGNAGQGGGGGGGENNSTNYTGGAGATGSGGGGGGASYNNTGVNVNSYYVYSGGGGGGGNGSAGSGGGYAASSSSNGANGSGASGGTGGNGTWTNNIFCYSNGGSGGGGGSDGRTDSSGLNTRAYMGGGGGASGGGYTYNAQSLSGANGGIGGGIIFIGANTLNIASAASVVANGSGGTNGVVLGTNYAGFIGGGGGGAGGSIILFANSISNSGGVSVNGGNGGGNPTVYSLYNGGAGGAGRTYARYNSFSGTVPFPSTNYSGLVATTDASLPYIITGTYTSTVIAPAGLTSFGILTFTNTLPTNTTFTVDVLDSSGNLLVTAVPSGTDLSNSYPTSLTGVTGIRLRGNFSTTNTSATPTLSEWGVGYSNFYNQPATSPVVETTAATYISTFTSADLNGIVNPNGLATNAYFQWGTTSSYGNTTAVQSLSGSSNVYISDTITGLSAGIPYYFRISATNSAGTTLGVNRTLGNWLETNFTTGIFSSCAATSTGATDIALSRINSGNGADGPLTVSNNFNINALTNGFNGRTAPDGVLWQITNNVVSGTLTISSSVPIPTGFAVGDEIMIIRIKGTSTEQPTTIGQYEIKRITALPSSTSMTVDSNLSNDYNGIGASRVQVQRIPNYTNVTINTGGSIICTGWNGNTGGVLAFRASGTLQVNVANGINATGLGFLGGTGTLYSNNAPGGESYNGTGGNGGTYATAGVTGQGGGGGGGENTGANNIGATVGIGSGGGGGGALYYSSVADYYLGGAGGGGGHAATGANGVSFNSGTAPAGTTGGGGSASYATSPLFTGGGGGGGGGDGRGTDSSTLNQRAFLGGGGGAGGGIDDNGLGVANAYGANGGNGGGIIFIGANILNIASSASIVSNGSAGANSIPAPATTASTASAYYSSSGPGGGGAGGSIIIYANTISNSGTAGNIAASPGSGGVNRNFSTTYDDYIGGTGSAGRIYVQYGGTFDNPPTVNYSPVGATYTTTSIGTYTSAIIAPLSVSSWGALTYTITVPTGTTFTVDVLNASLSVLVTGVPSDTNLSTYPALNVVTGIRLRANFSTTNATATPTLSDWGVGYEGP